LIEDIFGTNGSVLRETLMQIQTLKDFGKTLECDNVQLLNYIKIMEEYVYTTKTDINGILTDVSDSFCRISGYSREELVGYKHNVVRHPDNPDTFYANLWDTISRGGIWEGEVRNHRKDGSDFWMDTIIFPLHDRDHNIIGYSSMRQNITGTKNLQRQLNLDALTGLYNRRYYDEVLEHELLHSRREHRTITYVMMDIDNFKRYNDTYGHRKGDEVLSKIGKLLQQKLNENGHFAFRMGGEEFALLLLGLEPSKAVEFVENLRQSIIDLGIVHLNSSVADYVTASFGLVYIDVEHSIVDENALYSAADNALYKAKKQGRNCVYVHQHTQMELF
jgi:diguanylate cyclase (GGDEF)-like protein/PAS domain S-box-containing protein